MDKVLDEICSGEVKMERRITPKANRDSIIKEVVENGLDINEAAKLANVRAAQVRGWINTYNRKHQGEHAERELDGYRARIESLESQLQHHQTEFVEMKQLYERAAHDRNEAIEERNKAQEELAVALDTQSALHQKLNEAMVERKALLAQLSVQYQQISQVQKRLAQE